MLRLAMTAWQSRLWTALPAVVTAFPSISGLGPMIVDVQPTINGIVRTAQGTFVPMQMPNLINCPISWMGGGGVTATFPIKKGDEGLVILAARCIDAWWQNGWQGGSVSSPNPAMNPPDLRMHNLSDGFFLCGLRSLPRSFVVDTENACLITDDGQTYFKLNPTTKVIKVLATGGIDLNGLTIDSSGNLVTPGTVTGQNDVIAGTISGKGHVHPDGSPDTGPPVV